MEAKEIEILTAEHIAEVMTHLRHSALYPIVVTALGTGMRRGELLALRWSDVDLDGAKVRVERSLEQTKAGIAFKGPKTTHGRRTITLPVSAVEVLRAHRRQQLEHRMRLGLGKLSDTALVFPNPAGEPRCPRALTKEWRRMTSAMPVPPVSFHALRHSHASALIAAGTDIVTVSRRLGHSSPTVTLNTYSHLFGDTDQNAADAIDGTLAGL